MYVNGSWMPNHRPPASDSPTPDLYGGNNLPSAPETNGSDGTYIKEKAKSPQLHPR